MPRTDKNQIIGPDGEIIFEEIVQVPIPVIGPQELQQAKQTLRGFVQQFWDAQAGQPTGTPTNAQIRNAILALIVGERFLLKEMDDEV